jgi:hypothetical protein
MSLSDQWCRVVVGRRGRAGRASPRQSPARGAPDPAPRSGAALITLTCDSYGKVTTEGVPADPDSYDYHRAAKDAIHFAALFDRFIQNLRRYLGYDVQYFAAVEPQARLAPHIHMAIRSTVPRADLRQVLAATYHQVWWPSTGTVRYDNAGLPVWHEPSGRYVDPATGEFLPTWDQALDAIGADDEPLHTVRYGPRFHAQGVLAGSKDTSRCIGYLTKYLTKHVGQRHQADTDARRAHADRLAEALRYEPCSPTCANWLRYGIQPKNPRPCLRLRRCKGKAHRREYLGYAGRRVLVSRKWSGKTLADHRADRRTWLLTTLGIAEPDPGRYTWATVKPATPTTCPQPAGSSTSSPTASPGSKHSTKPDAAQPERPSRSFGNWEGCVSSGGMSLSELMAMPVMVDISTAARALGLGRSTAYELARCNEFPCRVLRVGSRQARHATRTHPAGERPGARPRSGSFLAKASRDRLHAAWRFSLYGLRRGEVLGLRWSDIDLKANTLTVNQARVLVEYKVRIEAPKSRNGKRTLPLDGALVTALTQLRKSQMQESAEAGTAYQAGLDALDWYQSGEYVITDQLGTPVHPEWYSDEFGSLLTRAGLRRITHA